MTASVAVMLSAATPALSRYLATQQPYLAVVARDRRLAGEIAPATALVASMRADAVARLEALGVPLLVAADQERVNRAQWSTVGTDWTRYALPHGCCRSAADSNARLRASVRRQCGELAFRTVDGAVARGGRASRPVPSGAVGIIPFGSVEYRGTLTVGADRLPVTWRRSWRGRPGDDRASDPLDARPHRFDLRRLPGARYWTVAAWSGRAEPVGDIYRDRAGCIAALSPKP